MATSITFLANMSGSSSCNSFSRVATTQANMSGSSSCNSFSRVATTQEVQVQSGSRKSILFQGASAWITSLSFTKPKPVDIPRYNKNLWPAKGMTSSRGSPLKCSLQEELVGVKQNIMGVDPLLAVKSTAAEISSDLKGTSIFLVGINNTIKTKLGTILADALRYYYFDSDTLVEQAAGGESAAKSLREIDEKGFLDSETEVLKQLSSMGRMVVCVGDGGVQSSTNLALLRHGISIWIDIPIHMLAREVSEGGSQSPLAAMSTLDHSEVLANLTAQYGRMKDVYAIADTTVSLQRVACQLGYDDMDAVIIEDMALEALKEIEKLTRVKKMMEAAARPF
ncbi:hypothetical protein AQUCO_02000510v1 [Aquilegia coerulea]|uniref:Shikimate kinase n=1 Tax=Aquilegia coerulea TaxID=218851 RepID=A0A2G5DHX4_AQUCA|nr:hypothetical protein AQUCO_02000510v1 [Aquilegia coerulea]